MSTIGHAQINGKLFSTGKLSCSDVTCVTQDGYGYIWIGTTYGLDRFDGYRFITIDTVAVILPVSRKMKYAHCSATAKVDYG